MLRWCAIYKDQPETDECTDEHAPPATVQKRFQNALRLGMHDGRPVKAMWLIDLAAEQTVIEVWGEVPLPVEALHKAYSKEKEKPR